MKNIKPRLKSANNRVSLNWTQISAIISGISAIDLQSLAIRTRKEAIAFAREYGFNMEDPAALDEIWSVHREAIAFIETTFLEEDQHDEIPEEIRRPEQVLDLLIYSSKYLSKSDQRQMWACAVLKVMHGIFHIDHDSKLMYFDEIRHQIFESIDRVAVRNRGKHYLVDDQHRLPLYLCEKKRNKGRWSILLKLLQKPSYVASDIYDHLGVRLVFETKAECLFSLKILRRSHLITVTNIKPFRSRNTLVDFKECQKIINRYRPLLNRSPGYPFKLLQKIDQDLEALYAETSIDNPHSSPEYRSIQVTARKMVRIVNPMYYKMQELMNHVGSEMIDRHFLSEVEDAKEMSFYFDFEIQIMDRKSYESSLQGPASHAAYKERQRATARKRVLGPQLMRYLEKKQSPKIQEAQHV